MGLNAKRLLCSIAASAISVASTALYAGSVPVDAIQHSTAVRFADLNLDQQRDVSLLYNRITFAVDQVCGPRSLTGSYSTSPGFSRCFQKALARAVTTVNRPQLTAYYEEQLARGSVGSMLAWH